MSGISPNEGDYVCMGRGGGVVQVKGMFKRIRQERIGTVEKWMKFTGISIREGEEQRKTSWKEYQSVRPHTLQISVCFRKRYMQLVHSNGIEFQVWLTTFLPSIPGSTWDHLFFPLFLPHSTQIHDILGVVSRLCNDLKFLSQWLLMARDVIIFRYTYVWLSLLFSPTASHPPKKNQKKKTTVLSLPNWYKLYLSF